jgi:type VI secretion system protein ImpF
MAELGLRERLQPLLLDRLVDDERLLTLVELRFERSASKQLGFEVRELAQVIVAHAATLGFAPCEVEENSAQEQEDGAMRLHFIAPAWRANVSRLKSLALTPPGSSAQTTASVTLQSFCTIETRNERNLAAEPAEQRQISVRRLRELVCRDLAVLLNSTSLDTSVDLSELPLVQRSVLNFGLPSYVGRSPRSLELREVARDVEEVIRRFEPRLTEVRVTPDSALDDDEHQINLRIDAQLWSQPAPQRLVLRTRICTDSGQVLVFDSGSMAAAR